MLRDIGALPYVLPECVDCDGMAQRKDHHRYDVLLHLFHTCENTPDELGSRLIGLLHDVGKPEAKRRDGNMYAHDLYGERIARVMLERLRYPAALVERVCLAIRGHMFDLCETASDATLRKRFAVWGRARTEDFIMIREADIRGSGYKLGYTADRWRSVYADMQAQGAPFSENELAVSGADIMKELGIPAGERVGRIKRQLLLYCAVRPAHNRPEVLKKRMHDWV
jgi:tRNA nucleotidyltransferase/poly(A) polymerase